MHQNAVEYDRVRGYDTRFASKSGRPGYPEGFVPQGRPCDWCGKPVDEGFIHQECQEHETDKWLNILY